MVKSAIPLPIDSIRRLCERRRVKRLALFGSVLRDDFRPDSDVDILVEFEPDATVGYFSLVRMADELSALIGRPVDLNTSLSLSRHIRERVSKTAEVIYERAG